MNQQQMAVGVTTTKVTTQPLQDRWCVPCGSTGWVYSSADLGGEKPCPRCKGTGRSQ